MFMYRTKSAALYLDVAPVTLEAWRVRGGGPEFVKMGKAVRYTQESLDKFRDSRLGWSTAQKGVGA